MQNADHLFACPLLPIKRKKEDFMTTDISDKAIRIAAYWEGKGIWKPTRGEDRKRRPNDNIVGKNILVTSSSFHIIILKRDRFCLVFKQMEITFLQTTYKRFAIVMYFFLIYEGLGEWTYSLAIRVHAET